MQPIFMDAKDDCFLTDVRPTEKTGQQALDIMTAPNKKYSAKSNITGISTAYYQTKNLIEAIGAEDENSFINRWGGEVIYDNYTIVINDRAGVITDMKSCTERISRKTESQKRSKQGISLHASYQKHTTAT